MLLGRGRECGVIDRVMRSAAPAVAAVLTLRGPAGVGKTALLEWAAASSSVQALWLRCTEGQQHLRWAALRELVKLLDVGLDGLIPWQRDTLAAALNGAAADPLAVGASLVALLSIAASVRPLLILIDDAQWIDEASRSAIRFAARRIDYDPVVLLMAEAVEETGDVTAESLPVLVVHGLSPIDAVTLLEGQVATKVAEELARVTEGNPLAMLEIARGLSPAQRSGTADLGSVLPLSEVLLSTFERRTAGLSDEQRRLLVLAAAEPDLDPERLRAATAEAGFDPALVETVVASGLLQTRDRRTAPVRAPPPPGCGVRGCRSRRPAARAPHVRGGHHRRRQRRSACVAPFGRGGRTGRGSGSHARRVGRPGRGSR